MVQISLLLLGSFQVNQGERPVAGFESNKVRALLAYLAVESDRPHSRDELVGLLWASQPEQMARANLRQALANLRQAIGDEAAQPPFLTISRDSIRFNPASSYWLDVAQFSELLSQSERHSHRHAESCRACADRLQRAVELYRGDFLEHFYLDSQEFDEWALVKREELHHLALQALDCLAEYHTRHEDWKQVYHYAALQVQYDAWREEAYQQAMRALYYLGQRSSAIRYYENCQRALREEFGVEPSNETKALYQHIRDETLPTSNRSQSARNLIAPDLLIGREADVAEITEILGRPGCRLVTLVGPGGAGKTCLARQAAAEQAVPFGGEVYFVSLYPLDSAEYLAPVIAETIGFPLSSREDPQTQLLRHLRKKEILIVLDNFEQLLSAEAVGILTAILEGAPGVVLLVTSRERLNLQAEWVFDVRGLPFPDPKDLSEIQNYSAVRLFVQRAARHKRQFRVTMENAQAIARICSVVEGNPLAIELAAAAVRTQSCEAISAEIESNLHALSSTMQDIPERHRSFWAVFEHSWQLLSPLEKEALQRLSVFRNGFSEEAAHSVACVNPPELWALMEKSLLPRDAAGRYSIHELILYFAEKKLENAGQAEQTRSLHTAYFLKLAEECEPLLQNDGQQVCLERLEREHDNLRAALEWSIGQHENEITARIGGAIWRFWWMHGHLHEGRQWLAKAMEACQTGSGVLSPTVWAKALSGAGGLAFQQGDYKVAAALLEECLSVLQEFGDTRETADVLNTLGLVALESGNVEQARRLLEQGLLILRQLGADEPGIIKVLNNLGNLAFDRGDYAAAGALFTESLVLARERGDTSGTATSLTNLGWNALLLNDSHQACRLSREALVIAHQLGNRPIISFNLECLAGVAGALGHLICSARLFGAAEALREVIQFPLSATNRIYYERFMAVTRSQLSQIEFEATWEAGRVLPLDQAVAEALSFGQ